MTDPEVDDGGSQQDANTLQQISHHVDEGRLHAGVAVTVAVAVALLVPVQLAGGEPVAVAVGGAGLMEDQHHPERKQGKV